MLVKNNVVVFTYHQSALPLLNFLRNQVNIGAIVLPSNRDKKVLLPVILWAKKNNVTYFKTDNCNEESFIQKIKKINPNLMIIFNFPQIFKKDLLQISRTINFHPGDLPKYRGAHVLNWALINGEKKIGVTCHFVNEGIDAGNIIAKKFLRVNDFDDINSLSKKVSKAVPILARRVLKKIADPNFSGERQNLQKSTYFKRRKPEEGQISWQSKAKDIQNLVRALTYPWPGAFTYMDGKKIIIDQVKIRKKPKIEPSKHLKVKEHLFFGAADGTVEVIKCRKKS